MDWTDRLRLRHLKMLLSLAHTGNISHSAAALNISQPALSKWLKDLESDLGLALFERHARGLRPTSHGLTLIEHARRLDAQLDRAAQEMAALAAGGKGRVVVGASGASASDTVPLAVRRLLEWQPDAHIKLVENTVDVLMTQLGQGRLDIVVGRAGTATHDPTIRQERLYMEPLHLVVRQQHPLLQKKVLEWPDLMAYRWLLWPKGTPVRDSLDEAVSNAGYTVPEDHVESNSVTINLTMLNTTNMIGVASHRSALRLSQMKAMSILPIRLSGFGSVAMYWRDDGYPGAAVEGMLEALRAVSREFGVMR